VTKKTVFIAFLSFSCFINLFSQTLSFAEKTELINQERKELEAFTKDRLDLTKFFVNGILYTQTFPPYAHPFYESDAWADGKLLYADQLVNISGIKYDILHDQLVYMNVRKKNSHPVILSPVFCREFYINNNHFRYINTDIDGNSASSLKPGYYEVIYDGNTKFYIRWEKNSKLHPGEAKQVMELHYSLYLYHDNSYTKIQTKRKLFKVLEDRQKELKDFVEQEKIVFTKENYSVSKRILQFYDTINE
jgi:hypothetical protein